MTIINSMPLKIGQSKIELEKTNINDEPVAIKVKGVNNGAILYFDCGASTTITLQGNDTVLGGDISVTVPGGEGFCSVDIGAAVQKSGEYKDHIILYAPTNDCLVGMIELI